MGIAWHKVPAALDWPKEMFPTLPHLFMVAQGHVTSLVNNTLVTMTSAMIGFLISIFLAIILAIIMNISFIIRGLLTPLIIISQITPKIALIPLISLAIKSIWDGEIEDIDAYTKIIIAMLISFLPMFSALYVGLSNIDNEKIKLFRSMGASKWQIMRNLQVKLAIPNFLSSLRVGFIFSVIGAITVEFIGSGKGLGYLILLCASNIEYDLLYLAVIVCILIGFIGYLILFFVEWLVLTLFLKRQLKISKYYFQKS